MLVWVHGMNQLPLEALEQIYSQSLHENARRGSYRRAMDDFLDYLRLDFFRQGGRCCFWKTDENYVAAVRFLPHKDGLLLAGLETAPDHRRQGCATRLLQAALHSIDMDVPLPIYAHVLLDNLPSLRIHEACGFSVLLDHAVLLDGTVSARYCTLVRYPLKQQKRSGT